MFSVQFNGREWSQSDECRPQHLRSLPLQADKENMLSPAESESEPHVYIYSGPGKCASALIEGRAKGNGRPPEWSLSDEHALVPEKLRKEAPCTTTLVRRTKTAVCGAGEIKCFEVS